MPITEQQKIDRASTLGSSDAAAACGVSSYDTPYELYMQKIGKMEPKVQTDPMLWGNIFENGVLDLAELEFAKRGHDVKIKRNQHRRHPTFPWWRANIDGIVPIGGGRPIDAKFCEDSDDWGPGDSDWIPAEHLIQGTFQAVCIGADTFYIAAFLSGFRRRFELYEIPVDPRIVERLHDVLPAFWECVQTKTPPDVPVMSLAAARRIIKIDGKLTGVPGHIVQHYNDSKENLKEAKKHEEEAKAQLLAYMDDAEVAAFRDTDGGRKVVWNRATPAGRRIDTKRLRAEMPEVFEKYSEESTRRVLTEKSLIDVGVTDPDAIKHIREAERKMLPQEIDNATESHEGTAADQQGSSGGGGSAGSLWQEGS